MHLKLIACIIGAILRCYGSSVFYNSVLSSFSITLLFYPLVATLSGLDLEADVCTVNAK